MPATSTELHATTCTFTSRSRRNEAISRANVRISVTDRSP
jgi:hypothetical protein